MPQPRLSLQPRFSKAASRLRGWSASSNSSLMPLVLPAPGFNTIALELETSPCTAIAQHFGAGCLRDECATMFRLQNSRISLESIDQIGTRKVKLQEGEKLDPAQGSAIRRCRQTCRRRSLRVPASGFAATALTNLPTPIARVPACGCGAIGTDEFADTGRFDRSRRHIKRCGRRSVRPKRSAPTKSAKRNLPDRAWRFGPTATLSGRGDNTFPAPVASTAAVGTG